VLRDIWRRDSREAARERGVLVDQTVPKVEDILQSKLPV